MKPVQNLTFKDGTKWKPVEYSYMGRHLAGLYTKEDSDSCFAVCKNNKFVASYLSKDVAANIYATTLDRLRKKVFR